MSRLKTAARPKGCVACYTIPSLRTDTDCVAWLVDIWKQGILKVFCLTVTNSKNPDADTDYTVCPEPTQVELTHHTDLLNLVGEYNGSIVVVCVELRYNLESETKYTVGLILEDESPSVVAELEQKLKLV